MSEAADRETRFLIAELAEGIPAGKIRAMRRGRTDAQFLERLRYERAMGERPRDDSVFNLLMLGRDAGLSDAEVFAMADEMRPGIRALSALSKRDRMALSRRLLAMEESAVERERVSLADAWAALQE